MAGKKQFKKKNIKERTDKLDDIGDPMKGLSGSEEDVREDETLTKKRSAEEVEEAACAVGNELQSMLERFGADISKTMQAKKMRLETLTLNYMKGSLHKVEQLWNNYHSQRQKITEQFSEQISTAQQQWETEAQRAEAQQEKLRDLIRQQQKILQQARADQNQRLTKVRELYEHFVKNTEDMQKSHEAFMQGAQRELEKEMAMLQKKILMDMQQQEMANIRKSIHSILF